MQSDECLYDESVGGVNAVGENEGEKIRKSVFDEDASVLSAAFAAGTALYIFRLCSPRDKCGERVKEDSSAAAFSASAFAHGGLQCTPEYGIYNNIR